MLLRLLPLLLPCVTAFGQALQPTLLTTLEPPLHETSGLLLVEGAIWTHGDSGNPNKLYRIDPATGNILRELLLMNAANVDWEDMTHDGDRVYVGDFGNNLGARTDLCIYTFPLDVLLDDTVTQVQCDTIRFAYADQTDFTPIWQSTNYDCEAFLTKDDSLFLFTKNWGNQRSHMYVLPANPGHHMAIRRDTLESLGMITGASHDMENGVIALLGFTTALEPFLWRLSDYTGTDLLGGDLQYAVIRMSPQQTEGIAWAGPDSVMLTNEHSAFGPAKLWTLTLPFEVGIDALERNALQLFPNPASWSVHVRGREGMTDLRVMDVRGREVWAGRIGPDGSFRVDQLQPGTYVVELLGVGERSRARLVVSR